MRTSRQAGENPVFARSAQAVAGGQETPGAWRLLVLVMLMIAVVVYP
jgi:hypothetical protein